MNSISTKTVRDLAVEIPGATRVFENLGIYYCCDGDRTLDDACNAAGLTVENVMTSLEQVNGSHAQFEEPNFLTATLAELIDHIVEKHHVFTKTEIARLRALVNKVNGLHEQNHAELAELREPFEALSDELGTHMMKEESVLFPYTNPNGGCGSKSTRAAYTAIRHGSKSGAHDDAGARRRRCVAQTDA
jgi:regulator of cell morphogenesis and NO signaling